MTNLIKNLPLFWMALFLLASLCTAPVVGFQSAAVWRTATTGRSRCMTRSTVLGVATDPTAILSDTAASSSPSRHRHAPIYSLQLINAVPVTIDPAPGSGQKTLWRPIVSRVTRISDGAVDISPPTQPKEIVIKSEPMQRVLAYRSVLRNWIRRVVGRGRRTKTTSEVSPLVAETTVVATTPEDTMQLEEAVDTEAQNQEEESVLQSLASQEAGAEEGVHKLQPVCESREQEIAVDKKEESSVPTVLASNEMATSDGASPKPEAVVTSTQATDQEEESSVLTLAVDEAVVGGSKETETSSLTLSSKKEEKLATTYKAVESLEEKVLTLLKNWGLIEPSLDFYI